jgi:hypothetical protein
MEALKCMSHSSPNRAEIQKDRINTECNRMSASTNRSMRTIHDIDDRMTAIRECPIDW